MTLYPLGIHYTVCIKSNETGSELKESAFQAQSAQTV